MHTRRRIIAAIFLTAALTVSYFLLLHFWYQPTYVFVYTDNSRIDGTLVKVVAENRGQVVQLPYDTDDFVQKDRVIATLRGTTAVGVPSDIGSQKFFYQYVLAPVSGMVVSRAVNPGDTVAAGQPLLTIANLDDIWVIANIDENEIRRVKPGQRVDIHVDATDEILQGKVEFIVPSTTSIVQQGGSQPLVVAANTQDVPVRISFEQKDRGRLYPGLSTEVTIYTR